MPEPVEHNAVPVRFEDFEVVDGELVSTGERSELRCDCTVDYKHAAGHETAGDQ